MVTIEVEDPKGVWAALYEARLDLLGVDAVLVPLGDTNHEAGDRTTVTTIGKEQVVFTYTEAVTSFDTPPTVEGPAHISVINFNQSDEWVETPDAGFWNDSAGSSEPSYTWILWVKVVAGGSGQALWTKSSALDQNGQDWAMYLNSSEKLVVRTIDDDATATIGRFYNTALSEAWHHIAVTKDDAASDQTDFTIYIDGEVITPSTTNTGSYIQQEDGTTVVRLGAESDGGSPIGGLMAGGPLGPLFIPVGTGPLPTADIIRRDYQLGRAALGV